MSQERRDDKLAGLGSLPVEQLSELDWQRMERRLFAGGAIRPADPAPARAPRTGWRIAAGGVVAAAAAVIAFLVWPRGDGPQPVGAPIVEHHPQIRSPSRIVTDSSPSAVSVGDVALDVAARSALLVDDDRGGSLLVVLERGEVACRVAPRRGRPPVVVQAGDARIEVVGTSFAVRRVGDSGRVEVYEGVVEVVHHGRRHRVATGETWPTEETTEPSSAAGARPERAGAAKPSKSPSKSFKRSPSHLPATPSAIPAPSDKERYERAASLESSDPRAALALYGELARGSGAWAANALFAQARLELELDHRDRARRLLESYIARYPRGPNAEDARQLLRRAR